MAKQTRGPDEASPAEHSDLKRKLAWRMGFAGLMIVMLLGTLALFDYLSAPDVSEAPQARFSEPVPVARKEVTQPVKPADPPVDTATTEQKTAAPEQSAAPIDRSLPPAEPPARPEVAAQPIVPRGEGRGDARSEAKVETRATTASRPSSSVLPQAVPPAATPAVPQKPADPRPPVEPAALSRPPLPAAGAPRLFSGYALQAGVFSDPRRAEELHARLTLNGIPSTLEARVQVGPFKTREEAAVAREKMKALGIDAVFLPPAGTIRR